MKNYPLVAIVGRTNVGKSTLFNRLSTHIKSLAFDAQGVTRDVVKEEINWQGRTFELVDTGGIVSKKNADLITQAIQNQSQRAIDDASIVLLMIDGVIGVLEEDVKISHQLHRLKKQVILVINKIDDKRTSENIHETNRLAHQVVVSISAQHGKNIHELLDAIVMQLPVASVPSSKEPAYKVAVIGKPNVGKSSLLNSLLRENRFIVADQPGTTREAIGELVTFYQEDILVTDTPGIRKKRAVEEPLEKLMVKSSFQAIENANIVLLMIDTSAGTIVDQELKLAFYIFEQQHKALLLIGNKQDLTDEAHQKTLHESLAPYKHFMGKIGTLFISCKSGKNVGKLMPAVEKLWTRYKQRFADDQLTVLFKNALMKKPLYKNQQRLHIVNARQLKTGPPTILLKVNQAHLFGDAHHAFFDGIMRKNFDLQGVPVKFIIKNG